MSDELKQIQELRGQLSTLIQVVKRGFEEHRELITKTSGALESHIKCMHFAEGNEVPLKPPIPVLTCKKCHHKQTAVEHFPCSKCENFSKFTPI